MMNNTLRKYHYISQVDFNTRERILCTSVYSNKQHWEGLGDPSFLDLTNFFEDTVHLYPQRSAAEIIPHYCQILLPLLPTLAWSVPWCFMYSNCIPNKRNVRSTKLVVSFLSPSIFFGSQRFSHGSFLRSFVLDFYVPLHNLETRLCGRLLWEIRGRLSKCIIWEETMWAELLVGAFHFAYSGIPQDKPGICKQAADIKDLVETTNQVRHSTTS